LESNIEIAYCKTPIGIAKITGNKLGVQSISIINENSILEEVLDTSFSLPVQNCILQLQEYFYKNRKTFDLKLNPKGTDFQKKVWNELLKIPYGKTYSYILQAKKMGTVKAIRAIAAANGKNPLWIVVPCHRVIGKNGSLTGYAGGIWRKKWLLEHENGVKQQVLFS
jgi:methylated-DNA-[protein]-cysteine S-methyltransferase